MLVQESLLREALNSKDMHDNKYESDDDKDEEEEEEALSLCDLPLYSSDQSAEWKQDLSSSDYIDSYTSNPSSSSQHDYFEFFSQELHPSFAAGDDFSSENIIFCGKVIPYKQPESISSQKGSSNEKCVSEKRLFRWKKHHSSSSRSTTLNAREKIYSTCKRGKLGSSMVLKHSSSGKANNWYLLFFGISRFSTAVELRDVKIRWSRRRSPPPLAPELGFEIGDEKFGSGERNRGWRLWEVIIRVLSCGGNHQSITTASAAAIGGSEGVYH